MRRTQAQIREEELLYRVHEVDRRWYGTRLCKSCGAEVKQTANKKCILIRNMRSTKLCKYCHRKAENNGFYGKRHSIQSKMANSASRTGKATGAGNAMAKAEHRTKVSSQLKKKYASGDLDFLREIQREKMVESQSLGKMRTAPVSKEEIQLKSELEAEGLKVEAQFRIGSLKYDLMIPDRKVIVEFHGDYWHCNPKQYAPDYLHKKKSLYAHEIWAHDAHKKMLAESEGYRLICVWDSEYKTDKNYLNKLIDDIQN